MQQLQTTEKDQAKETLSSLHTQKILINSCNGVKHSTSHSQPDRLHTIWKGNSFSILCRNSRASLAVDFVTSKSQSHVGSPSAGPTTRLPGCVSGLAQTTSF